MLNNIKQLLKEQKMSVFYYALGLILYIWMIVAMFPSIKNFNFEEYFAQMPKELQGFIGENPATAYSTIEGFISGEFLSFFFVFIVSFYIAASAGSIIAGLIEKKVMDFQLSQPLSRTRHLLSGSVVSILYSIILTLATTLSTYLFCQIYNVAISFRGLAVFSLVAVAFSLAIFGFAIFLSSILRSKLAVVSITVFVLLAEYIFLTMTRAVEKLQDYDKLSIFYLYNPQKLLTDATINWSYIGVFILIFVLGFFGSILIFNKKDI